MLLITNEMKSFHAWPATAADGESGLVTMPNHQHSHINLSSPSLQEWRLSPTRVRREKDVATEKGGGKLCIPKGINR